MIDHSIKNHSVIFVGPALSTKGKGLGKWIDSFDVVIRTNGSIFLLDDEKFNNDYGKKCSILFLNNQFQRNVNNIDVEKLKSTNGLKNIYCRRAIQPLYDIISNRGVPVKEIGLTCEIKEIRGPLMGTIIMDFVVKNNPSRFWVTGVDFYNNRKNPYYPGYLPESIEKSPKKNVKKKLKRVHDGYANNFYIYSLIKQDKIKVDDITLEALKNRIAMEEKIVKNTAS